MYNDFFFFFFPENYGQNPKRFKRSPKLKHEDEEEENDFESDVKELSALACEDEKTDTEEIEVLLKIQSSVQKLMEKQEVFTDLVTGFVKSRRLCQMNL